MATYTKQPSSKDGRIASGYPTTNYGSESFILTQASIGTGKQRSLLEFDISGLPLGVAITTAKLKLYYYNYQTTDPVGRTIWAYKLYPDKVTPSEVWEELQATWNIYKTGEVWDSPGGDYKTSSPSGGSAVVPAGYGWMEWDIKAIVEDAIANENDLVKLLVKDAAETYQGAYYDPVWYSKESSNTTLRPKIEIEYTPLTLEIDTLAASNIQETSATLNGEITNLAGGGNADERGFVYATQSYDNPGDVAPADSEYNDNGDYVVNETDSFGVEAYELPVTGLTEATKYYVRAYAHNTLGYAYGDEVFFGWLSGYSCRKKLTIDHDKVDASLTDFPTLVKLTSSNFDFSKPSPNGYDIQFTSEDGLTPLSYERELYDAANQLAYFWVKVPSVSSSADTDFYMYYGVSETMYEMFLDAVYVDSKDANLSYMRGTADVRPTKYSGNPIFGNSEYLDAGIDDGGVFTSDVTDLNDAGAADFPMLPVAPVEGADSCALCMKNPNDRIKWDISTPMASDNPWALTWEYYDTNSAWASLSGVSDGTEVAGEGFSQDGYVKWTIPADWKSDGDPYGANGETGYWIRARLTTFTANGYTQPLATQGWIDTWDYDKTYINIVKDGDTLRMLCGGIDPTPTGFINSYATSSDGLVWTKPNLGVYTYDGTTDNNVIADLSDVHHPTGVKWDSSISKWVAVTDGSAGSSSSIIYSSSDFIAWAVEKNIWSLLPDSKSGVMALEKRPDGRWMYYHQGGAAGDIRYIAVMLADDANSLTSDLQYCGINIPYVDVNDQPYCLSVNKYGQAYVALVPKYDDDTDVMTYIELWISRDGLNFTKIDTQWLAPGGVGAWDEKLLIDGNFVQVSGDADSDWWFYYSGSQIDHASAPRKQQVGIAKIGYGRLGGVKRDAGDGTVTTTLIRNATGTLSVNVDTSNGADKLEVELLDSADDVITGYAQADADDITDNNASKTVTWGSSSVLPSQDFKIKFYLTGDTGPAKLYAFSVEAG